MIFQNNYFGAFTNYSTVAEYLTKRAKNQPIGDPVDLKYQPGKVHPHFNQKVRKTDPGWLGECITGYTGCRRSRRTRRFT